MKRSPSFYFGKGGRVTLPLKRTKPTPKKSQPPPGDLPVVHCIMPTTQSRRWCIERSIRCWLKQDYPLDRRRLVVIDGPNSDGTVRDLVPFHPRIHYVALYGREPGTPGDKYNLGASLADTTDLIALWADDDWHHPQRISLVVDAMGKAGVEIGGTISMMTYRMGDKKLFIFLHPYVMASKFTVGPSGSDDVIDLTMPYLVGGTMIFSKRSWAEVGGFKPLPRGTDSEFIHRLVLGREQWDLDGVRLAPDYGDQCATTVVGTIQFGRIVHESALVQLAEPRLYCAIAHHDNTGNPIGRGHDGGETFQLAGEAEMTALKKLMGPDAEEFLR